MKTLMGARFGAWSFSHLILLPHLLFSTLLGSPWLIFQRAVLLPFSLFGFLCRRRHRPLLPEVAECKRLVKPRPLCTRAFPLGFSDGEFIDINDVCGKFTLTPFYPVWHNPGFRAVVPPDFDTVPYLMFQEVGPAMSALFECLSFLVVCDRSMCCPCKCWCNVFVLSFARIHAVLGHICCNQRSRLPSSRGERSRTFRRFSGSLPSRRL